jgi:hypothetical protein
LHEQLVGGVLPLSELSRDNLRELFRENLGVDFSNWDKFDAVCQRIDSRKKGFVSWENVVSTFRSLPALTVPLHNPAEDNGLRSGTSTQSIDGQPKHRQYCLLLLLTLVCDSLTLPVRHGKDILWRSVREQRSHQSILHQAL